MKIVTVLTFVPPLPSLLSLNVIVTLSLSATLSAIFHCAYTTKLYLLPLAVTPSSVVVIAVASVNVVPEPSAFVFHPTNL